MRQENILKQTLERQIVTAEILQGERLEEVEYFAGLEKFAARLAAKCIRKPE